MAHPPRQTLLAILLMFGAVVAFSGMQAVVKSARLAGMHTSEVMFFRTAPGLPLLWWSLRRGGHGLWPDQPRSVLVRSAFGSLAMSTNFTAMFWLTLAQFSTLGLMQPVFVALLSPLLLRERIHAHTWLAMTLAFAGAFAMLVPALNAHTMTVLPSLLGLVSALSSAFAHIWVRKSTETDPAERVVFHFGAWVCVGALVVGLSQGAFREVPPGLDATGMLLTVLGMSAFGTAGQVLMTRAHVFGEAATISLVGYTGVAFSVLLDALLWNVLPGAGALAGALLMIAAGIVLVRKS